MALDYAEVKPNSPTSEVIVLNVDPRLSQAQH